MDEGKDAGQGRPAAGVGGDVIGGGDDDGSLPAYSCSFRLLPE